MRAGYWNLAFGLAAVAAGASGKYTLPIVNSSMGLVIAGAAVALLGAFQLWQSRGR
jgi:hypothetical protein